MYIWLLIILAGLIKVFCLGFFVCLFCLTNKSLLKTEIISDKIYTFSLEEWIKNWNFKVHIQVSMLLVSKRLWKDWERMQNQDWFWSSPTLPHLQFFSTREFLFPFHLCLPTELGGSHYSAFLSHPFPSYKSTPSSWLSQLPLTLEPRAKTPPGAHQSWTCIFLVSFGGIPRSSTTSHTLPSWWLPAHQES